MLHHPAGEEVGGKKGKGGGERRGRKEGREGREEGGERRGKERNSYPLRPYTKS